MPDQPYSHDLRDAEPLGAARIGGKAAGLARLWSMGVTTPPGVAVTVDAFDDHVRHLDLANDLRTLETGLRVDEPDPRLLKSVRDAIAAGPPPTHLLDELEVQARQWREDGGSRLIVRSSATVEDSTAHSYAGIFESITVDGVAQLGAAITNVWASAFSGRAVAYYRLSGLRRFPQVALVVQPFIEADYSGVMFTTYPRPDGGDEALLIEYVEGDCEKLVTGAANPERLWLRRGDTPAGTAELDASVVARIADAARTVESAFGAPQDIEWCLRSADLYLLQARPITTAGGAPSPVASYSADVLVSGLGASAGCAGGAAHLVFNIEDADRLERGHVLVTTMTNPDMVAAMQNSSAVVTDVGGMICHAAIVSRELRIPCVVGTETATSVIAPGSTVTVDGDAGAVYAGVVEATSVPAGRSLEWSHLWRRFESLPGRVTPVVSTARALEHAPPAVADWLVHPVIDARVDDHGHPIPGARTPPPEPMPETAVPLAAAFLVGAPRQADDRADDDGAGVFGRQPGTRDAPMPDAARRRVYHQLVPELQAAHADARTAPLDETFTWLDLRPEIAITPMLRSLVLPGIETIPRAMRFHELPPLHVKWIRCRFHFRRDTFGATWMRLQEASWDPSFMDDMLARRTRASYDRLDAAAAAFPTTDEAWREAPAAHLRELFLAWWHAFVHFFSLSFFIQAQGDDCMAPYVAEVVARHGERLDGCTDDFVWPGVAELTAPTRPVLTAEYMADLLALKHVLADGGRDAVDAAVGAFRARWHWMRERDPYFPPYDGTDVIIAKARAARDISPPDYETNVRRMWLALSARVDLEIDGGNPERFVHAVSYGHALALERENHHIVWLKASYPFRKLCIEWERRLREVAPLRERDVFFMEAPEVLAAIDSLPEAPPETLLRAAVNRRSAYHREMRLTDPAGDGPAPCDEDDYF